MLFRTAEHERISSQLIEVYFKTICNVLLTKINETDGLPDSLFNCLKQNLKVWSVEEYKKHHRTRLEYYYKLCRKAIAAELITSPS